MLENFTGRVILFGNEQERWYFFMTNTNDWVRFSFNQASCKELFEVYPNLLSL